jgi:hypothetical protein
MHNDHTQQKIENVLEQSEREYVFYLRNICSTYPLHLLGDHVDMSCDTTLCHFTHHISDFKKNVQRKF